MIINYGSNLDDIRQAIKGTWSVSTDDGWVCKELGEIKIYKKLCNAGDNILPSTFMKNRTDIVPFIKFEKNGMSGGIITQQDQYITLEANALVVILVV